MVKLERKGMLVTAAATLTPSDVGGWHKRRKVHDWNGSTKEMAKLLKSGGDNDMEKIGVRDLLTSRKLPRKLKEEDVKSGKE